MTYDYECHSCGHIQEEVHSYKLITNDENDYAATLVCKECKNIGTMFRKINPQFIAIYNMASPEEKKEMLKKRSKNHFKKEVEEAFHAKNKPDYIP